MTAGKRTKNSGILINIEGIDGTGKTTQGKILVDRLNAVGYDSILLHEPTHSKWGLKIRDLFSKGRSASPEDELKYFIEDRKIDVTDNILPALNRGCVVVIDRYYISNAAYQGALGIDPKHILELNSFAPVPDIILILDISAELGLSRIRKRESGQPNSFEEVEYQHKVRMVYQDIARILPNAQVIDASPTIDTIADVIWNICIQYIEKNGKGRVARMQL